MNSDQLFEQIKRKRSFLCVGLDTELGKLPLSLKGSDDPVFEFNRRIIDATAEVTVAYKPNLAFYESQGPEGWISLGKTVEYLKSNYPEIFIIADAKRGDIGNTSRMYAQTFFEKYNFDAVTVAPYMGEDSVVPFLNYNNKWVILLALTSNKGADNFQYISEEGEPLFIKVIRKGSEWGNTDNIMFVVGATRAEMLEEIRRVIPNHFLLIPGIGAQGGSLEEVVRYGMNQRCGLLVNSSRGIIYASDGNDFDVVARQKAMEVAAEMASHLSRSGLI